MRSSRYLQTLALPERNSSEASSRKDGEFESLTTVFSTGLTMVPKRFESSISGTVEKYTAESAPADGDAGRTIYRRPKSRFHMGDCLTSVEALCR